MEDEAVEERPRRREGLAGHRIVDDVLLYDPVARQTHVLNPTAATIWERCDGERSTAVLVDDLAAEFGVAADDISEDVRRAIRSFADLGLLEGSEPPEAQSSPIVAPSASDEGLPDPDSLDLPHATEVLDVTGAPVRYRADHDTVIDYLSQVLAPLVAADGVATAHDVLEIRILGPDEGGGRTAHAVWVGDRVVGRPSGARGVAGLLLWDLNRLAISLGEPRLSFHAGAVAAGTGAGRRIVLLPAAPDSGKSTLTLGLVRSGLAYLGDEAFGIALGDRHIIPYLKPLTLDPGSWPLFPDLEPRFDERTEGYVHGKWHIDVRGVGGGVAPEPTTLSLDDVVAVVLPRYEAGAPTRLERLAPSELAVALAENAFNLAETGQAGVGVLADLAAGAEGWRLVSGDLDEAVAAVRALLD